MRVITLCVDVFEAIGFWYLLISILNSSVAILWVNYEKVFLSSGLLIDVLQFFHLDLFAFVGLLWQLATLVFVYHRLRDYPPRNGTDHAFVNAPFSIYTAYSLFIVLWQIFQFSNETKQNQIVRHLIILQVHKSLTFLHRCIHLSLSLLDLYLFTWQTTHTERIGYTL